MLILRLIPLFSLVCFIQFIIFGGGVPPINKMLGEVLLGFKMNVCFKFLMMVKREKKVLFL